MLQSPTKSININNTPSLANGNFFVFNKTMEEEQNYKTPKPEDAEFTKYWNLFVDDVAERKNFKPGHLEQLKILCEMYQQFYDNTEQLKEEGFSFESTGRNGVQYKPHPVCAIRDKCIAEIRQFSKLLGLVLLKDEKMNTPKEKDEWDD